MSVAWCVPTFAVVAALTNEPHPLPKPLAGTIWILPLICVLSLIISATVVGIHHVLVKYELEFLEFTPAKLVLSIPAVGLVELLVRRCAPLEMRIGGWYNPCGRCSALAQAFDDFSSQGGLATHLLIHHIVAYTLSCVVVAVYQKIVTAQRKHLLLISIGAITLGLLSFAIGSYRVNLACYIRHDFPGGYNVEETLIYYYRLTQGGDYHIVIYGDGSAYYFDRGPASRPTAAKSGVLPAERVQELVRLFQKGRFHCLKESYPPLYRSTGPTVDYVSLTVSGVTKTVEVEDAGWGSVPPSFREITDELRASAKDLPRARPEEADRFCTVIVLQWDKIAEVNTDDWTDSCRKAVGVSTQ
jgi:hypothetical protein